MPISCLHPLGWFCLAALASYALHAGPVPPTKPHHYPDWWFERDVIVRLNPADSDPVWSLSYAPADDFAVANQGQLKQMARQAYAELVARYPAHVWTTSRGEALWTLLRGWHLDDELIYPKVADTDSYAAVNLGQLKYVAAHFYDVLQTLTYSGPPLEPGQTYPWDGAQTPPDHYALVNLGQLKRVFSFNPALPSGDPLADVDADGLPDAWEIEHFGHMAYTSLDDPDGDGYINLIEHRDETDPNDPDSHPDAHFQVVPPGEIADGVTTFVTLRAAVDAAQLALQAAPPTLSHAIIAISPGRYTGSANTNLIDLPLQNILIMGSPGADVILEGHPYSPGGIELGDDAGLYGLTLKNIRSGVTVRGDRAFLARCVIRGVSSAASAALFIDQSADFAAADLVLENNDTRAVDATASSLHLGRLQVFQNTTTRTGAAFHFRDATNARLANSLVSGHRLPATRGLVTLAGASCTVRIEACSIFDNLVEPTSGAILATSGHVVEVIDSVLWNPLLVEELVDDHEASTVYTVSMSLVRGGWPGEGNLNADPLLHPSGTPQPTSPVIDMATPTASPSYDVHGQPRLVGGRSDIGAVELQPGTVALPEWWQLRYFSEVGVEPTEDADSDGTSNEEEFLARTDPVDPLNGVSPVFSLVDGDGQRGSAGSFLARPLVVHVTTADGRPVAGLGVRFTAHAGSARFNTSPTSSGEANPMDQVIMEEEDGAQVYLKP